MAITFTAAAIVVIIKSVLISTKIFLAEKHARLLEAMCVSFNNTGVKVHHIQKD
jgi:predicted permease